MSKKRSLLLLIILLAGILVLLVYFANFLNHQAPAVPTQTYQPSTNQTVFPVTQSTQSVSQTPSTQTQLQPQATESSSSATDTTEATETLAEFGSIYTRAEIEALSKAVELYGPGKSGNGKRPSLAVSSQTALAHYNAAFIGQDNNRIYLTFNCNEEGFITDTSGKEIPNTQKILDVLQEKNVKAVFFVTRSFAQTYPDLILRIIQEGHILGNYTASGVQLPELKVDEIISEILTLHDYVLKTFGYEMSLLRAPGGAYSEQSLAITHNLGYQTVFWSFSYYDYDTEDLPNNAYAYEAITSKTHSGAIYQLHTTASANAEILEQIIGDFRSNGYTLELFR